MAFSLKEPPRTLPPWQHDPERHGYFLREPFAPLRDIEYLHDGLLPNQKLKSLWVFLYPVACGRTGRASLQKGIGDGRVAQVK